MAGAQSLQALAKAHSQAMLSLTWGLVSTPLRLVTQTIPNFARAVIERLQGKDRFWDVIFTGAMVEGDVAATYGIGRGTGLVDRANTALENRLFGSGWGFGTGTLPEFQSPYQTGQWRSWDLPEGVNTPERAQSWANLQRHGLSSPNRTLDPIPGPMLPESKPVTLPRDDFNNLTLGSQGDKQTVLLWTADERGVNFVLEQTPWPTSRPSILDPDRTIISHTNISDRAYAGGEAWRTGYNQVTISSASGAYGYNWQKPETWASAAARYEAAVQFLRDLGLDVISLPFGRR